MDESPVQDDMTGWKSFQQRSCPHCGSARVVPAAAEWAGDSYCLDCRGLIAAGDEGDSRS